ncbi:LysR substrate-binding domain-containing protein [Paracoccus aerodenitrificans]|uniref:LysR substrate-binding domain-containing protein n=1 Tax=Paracoccus aerodenitrificans TaxID=3017781 RepID=UPI0022F11FA2|nr:LysR substrate-binding domain-containing protein [Paracoccus aerodenitrificans]WBU65213.1 LysR substrate-binding domain-containing protein [Paracoccus aerodenitrificans]
MPDHIVINSVPMMGDLVVPAVMHICRTMPEVKITYRSDAAVADLSDLRTIGVRSGPEPVGERLAIRWLGRIGVTLVASQDYIARFPLPDRAEDLRHHDFASNDFCDAQTPWSRWLHKHVEAPNIVFRTNDETLLRQAIKSGRCTGFLPVSSLIWSGELVELMPARDEWASPLWLVHDRHANAACRSVAKELADMMSRQLM